MPYIWYSKSFMKKIYRTNLQGPYSLITADNYGQLLEKVFRVKDTGIDPKIYHSWKMAGIISTVEAGKWASLSFIEYLWIRTLESMRRFGCSLKLMISVHEYLFSRAYKDNLAKKTLIDNIEALTNRSREMEENEYLRSLKEELSDPIRMATTDKEITYFYQLVLRCFTSINEVGLVIYEDNTFDTYENPIDDTTPHLLIPISYFIKNFVADAEKEQFLTSTGLLNTMEFEIVKQIRNKNVKSVTISLKDGNSHVIEPEVTGDVTIIMHSLGLKNYSRIELHTKDCKEFSIT